MNQHHYPRVIITDETLRDGLQIERLGVTVEEKLEVLELLVASGLRRLVVGAFVNAKWSPQMAETEQLVDRLKAREGVQFFALALNDRGREIRAGFVPPLSVETLPTTHLHLCETFLLRNTNRSVDDQERTWRLPVQKAVAAGAKEAVIGLSSAWGSNWRGAFSHEQRMNALQRQWDEWTQAGIAVRRVEFADPMGWNRPDAIEQDMRGVFARFGGVSEIRLHLHNARGMAMLSAWEALKALDSRHTLLLDSAVGGIGGCPYSGNGQANGMLPTEDLVHLLNTLGIETAVDLDRLIEASHRLAAILKRPLHSQVALNGQMPKGERLFAESVPVVYTFHEAQHFRLGPGVYEGNPTPWIRKPAPEAP